MIDIRSLPVRLFAIVAAAALLLSACTRRDASGLSERPTTDALRDLQADVHYLASDELEGRLTGSAGIRAAEQYIAERFEEAGLVPIDGLDGYFQDFTVTRVGFDPSSISLAVHGPPGSEATSAAADAGRTYTGSAGVDFRPLSECGASEFSGELVYAGFGIDAPEADHNDYDGLNVRGKIALVLRGEPEPVDPTSPFYGPGSTHHAYFRTKAETAYRRGAAGIIVVNTMDREERPTDFTVFESFRLEGGRAGGRGDTDPEVDDEFIAFFSSSALLEWVAPQWGLVADRAVAQASLGVRPVDLTLEPLRVEATVARRTPEPGIPARNVAAMLPGAENDRIIVVGAHHDHLGTVRNAAVTGDPIFNGADDNASGTAAVMEVARQLSGAKLDATVYFVTFSSEEQGLLGATAFVSSGLPRLRDIDFMINVDMTGRNTPEPFIVLNAGGLPLGGASIESVAEEAGLPVTVVGTGVGGSDHIPFQFMGVPIVFLTSGFSDDYHGVDDEADRIEYDRLHRSSQFVRDMVLAASRN